MSAGNTSAANLAAEETKIEGLVVAEGQAEATAFTDLKVEIAAALATAGVPAAQVDAITAKMTAFEATITAQTAAAKAADPGTTTPGS